jgi:hypothetical protein
MHLSSTIYINLAQTKSKMAHENGLPHQQNIIKNLKLP